MVADKIQQLAHRRSATQWLLGAAAAFLVLAHLGLQLTKYWTGHDYMFGLVNLFHLGMERNIPTFFSTLLLLLAAVVLAYIATDAKQQRSRDVSKWTVLAAGFLYMAIDESCHIHELLVDPVRELLGNRPLGIFYYAWVIPAIVVVFVLAIFFMKFLLRLPARPRRAFIVAAMLYLGGAIGLELVEGRHYELYGRESLTYMLYVTTEEGLEMAGVIVFVHALLQYIVDNDIEVRQSGTGMMFPQAAATATLVQGGCSSVGASASFDDIGQGNDVDAPWSDTP